MQGRERELLFKDNMKRQKKIFTLNTKKWVFQILNNLQAIIKPGKTFKGMNTKILPTSKAKMPSPF